MIHTMIKEKLFGQVDFKEIDKNPEFKEDSVREVIINPILFELGYKQDDIIRSKILEHPFLTIGSKKRHIKLIPDYVMKVANNFAWVLDAKAPCQKVTDQDHIEQVYSYATHPEIRSTYFALCNGLEFSLFRREQFNNPILHFPLDEIEYYWPQLKKYLAPDSFQLGKNFTYNTTTATYKPDSFDYISRPLLEEIPVKKQQAKRHFGVHGYFTKQTWNVVADYIKNYTRPGDIVLDPFGGSGVTAIEAMMNNRKAISIDINPMAVFVVKALIAPVRLDELTEAFKRVQTKFQHNIPETKKDIEEALKKYSFPQGYFLPKGSDVNTVEELFSKKQLAQLSLLKNLVKKEREENIKNNLLLMFSGLLTKANLTYHTTPGKPRAGQGDAAAFRYYRYRIAPNPVEIDIPYYFKLRCNKVIAAKKEMIHFINSNTFNNIQILQGTATDLHWIPKESIDYIYTDPPYGKKIPYLDLSVMWNAWLDLPVTEKDRELEAIEGGELKKSKSEYNHLIYQSIKEMYRVLKFDRWLSFVFAHKDPGFWHLIIESAESCGLEYAGAVPQKNGQTSFKKRQHPFTVLSGQLIINFKKVRNPRAIMKANLGLNIAQIVIQTIEGIIAKNDGATLEQINDELIIKGLELGFLDLLKKEYSDLTPFLLENFDYSEDEDKFTLRRNAKFKTQIDERLRIRYYLISFLRRMEMENKIPNFDEIVLNIIPLLKNGRTPEDQTILGVLKDIGEHIGEGCWKLKRYGQGNLFDSTYK